MIKRFLAVLLAALGMAASLFADKPLRTGYTEQGVTYNTLPKNCECVTDTIIGTVADTLTFWHNREGEFFGMYVYLDSLDLVAGATDSFHILYRPIARLEMTDVAVGSLRDTLGIINAAGATVKLLTWSNITAGAQFRVAELNLVEADLYQFFLKAGLGTTPDSVHYKVCFKQGKPRSPLW